MEDQKPVENEVVEKPVEAELAEKKPFPVKIAIILALLFVAFLIVFVVVLLNSGSKNSGKDLKVEDKVESTQILYDSVIGEGIKYIDLQKRSDNFYEYLAHFDDQCSMKDGVRDCPFSGSRMFETTNAWTALAHFSAYKALGDNKALEKSSNDLSKLMDWCAIDPTNCNWVLAQPSIIYQHTKEPILLEFLKKQANSLLSSKPSNDAMLVAIESRELSLLYQILKDQKLLTAAKARLEMASNLLSYKVSMYGKDKPKFSDASCWVGLASSQLAIVTGDSEVKNNTIAFLENGKISQNFDLFYNPLQIQPCIESYLMLGNLEQANHLMTKFINKYYDGKDKKIIYGEGGTILEPNTNSKMIILTDSAYTVFLAGELKK